ncbi:TF-B3 domain-containing protein [Heracleum sosnowskyi]|uniref:TF-B3 domain-containing protein n=1 Tax=Heracleum sosnowskyi TaxID=360622 RepID=A0AAD8JDW6_9APIA|nr:TF-B3 domain-containing protein [Heracleum sosnowskyi]
MAIPQVQPTSKDNKALDPKKKIVKNRDANGLHTSKHKKVVAFDLDKPIASYQPKVERIRNSHESDRKKSSQMDRALEIQANLASQFPSFLKNMLPSHVAGCFWLGLPKNFADMHLPKHDKTVVLVDENELEHETKYLAEKNGLSAGWRGFAIAHKLQEKDVLVFHLIQQCKFKVYIVRANVLSEVDGAIGFLNLGTCVREIYSDHQEEGMKITSMEREKQLEQYSSVHSVQEKDMVALTDNIDAAADNCGMDINMASDAAADNYTGIRFSQSVVNFEDVKSFENFNVVVDGLNIDCEIPQNLRVKYYELCCSQKSYLHDQLIDGMNLQLVVGVILETINIADAIRNSKPTTCENLKVWDNTLKAFEIFGMKVGFLRARMNKLLTLSSDSEEALKHKIFEKVKAEEELKTLEIKSCSVKEVIQKSNYEIEAMKKKAERLEDVFMEESKAPW